MKTATYAYKAETNRVPKSELLPLGAVAYRLEIGEDHLWYTDAHKALLAWERAAGIGAGHGIPGVPTPLPTTPSIPVLYARIEGREKRIR